MLRRTLFLALLALGIAGVADARQETVRWTHPLGAQVGSFHIFVGTSPGASDLMSQSVGLPTPDASGIYAVTIDLATDETVYVRMTAVDAAQVHSPESNEIIRSVPLGVPGTPVVAIP